MATLNVYEIVTNRILEQLEQGIIPWEKGWTGCADGAYSYATKKPYSYINQMLLSRQGAYLTFNQVKKLKGHVKKGAKSEICVFFKPYPVKRTTEDGTTEDKLIPLLRYYTVFHQDNVEGIEFEPISTEIFADDNAAEQIAQDYFKRESIQFSNERGDRAYYSPSRDKVVLPLKEQFEKQAEYYSTLYHEMVHSTGYSSRLNRFKPTESTLFGSTTYSKEELVAEMGAAFSMNKLGLETMSSSIRNAAYVQSWLRHLKSDPKLIVQAASKAQKAVEFIFNEKKEDEDGKL